MLNLYGVHMHGSEPVSFTNRSRAMHTAQQLAAIRGRTVEVHAFVPEGAVALAKFTPKEAMRR